MASCSRCGKSLGFMQTHPMCDACRSDASRSREAILDKITADRDAADRAAKVLESERLVNFVITTEPTLPGITKRLGIVSAEVVIGTNIFRDIGQSLRSVVGGRGQGYQMALRELRDQALAELRQEALALKADAVVAVDLDYSQISSAGAGQMLFLVASGTAVELSGMTA